MFSSPQNTNKSIINGLKIYPVLSLRLPPSLRFYPTVDTRTTPHSDSPTSLTLHQPDN